MNERVEQMTATRGRNERVRRAVVIITLLAAVGVASHASAAVITLGTAATVDGLFAGTAQPVGSVLLSQVVTTPLSVDIYSQAYTDGSEYAYLYQLDNKTVSTDPVEMFTLSPFAGADENVVMGYLTGQVPSGFLSGVDQNPEPTGNFNPSGPLLSFYYTSRAGFDIDPGQQSAVMYVMSDLSPDLIWGNVIDGATGSDEVVGPVPEPASASLLVLGLGVVLRRRRRSRIR